LEVDAYMVSLDDVAKNREFAESLDAGLVLLSDEDGVAAADYGVVGPLRPFPRRWTFFIDSNGIIIHIDTEVTPATAGPAIADTLELLGIPRRPASTVESPTVPNSGS
jgi:peroxiredoxin